MEYQKAKDIADRIVLELEPYCEIINIAGSVRREKPDCGDIEIVCLPKVIVHYDLFQNPIGGARSQNFIHTMERQGKILKGSLENGRYVQIELLEGISLDLFIPEETDYFRQYVIRTGSADYTAKVIATAWVKNGWRGTTEGLRLEKECYSKDLGNGKTKWICNSKTPTLPPVWPDEKSFFEWLKIKYIEPIYR